MATARLGTRIVFGGSRRKDRRTDYAGLHRAPAALAAASLVKSADLFSLFSSSSELITRFRLDSIINLHKIFHNKNGNKYVECQYGRVILIIHLHISFYRLNLDTR